MRHCLFKGGLVADDADDMVVHLDPIDHRADIGFPERDLAGRDIVAHDAAERINRDWIKGARSGLAACDSVKHSFRLVAAELQIGDSFFQDIVELGHPILHHAIEPFQLLFRFRDIPPQGCDALIDLCCLSETAFLDRGQERGQAIGLKQMLGELICDEGVELVHGNDLHRARS